MKSKLVAILMTGIMAMGIVGCGGSTGGGAAESAPAQAESSETAEAETGDAGDSAEAESGDAGDSAEAEDAGAAEEAEAGTEEATAESEEAAASEDSDVSYIKDKGKLIVGITDFAPMDYQEGGDWIGFDADMAKKVAEDLGVEAEFIEIDWDNKILELNNKSIDVVWNGMTLTDEVKSSMECSNAYCNNAQVVVLPKDKADQYKDTDSLKDLTFAVEAGSAGEAAAEENGFNYTSVTSQADTLMEVEAGTSDASIIDLLMAGAMVGDGTSYEDLTHTVELTTEEYVVGCRKGSDLAAFINDEFKKFADDGSLQQVAETYGVQDALIQ